MTLHLRLFQTCASSHDRPKQFTSSLTPCHHVVLRQENGMAGRERSGRKLRNFIKGQLWWMLFLLPTSAENIHWTSSFFDHRQAPVKYRHTSYIFFTNHDPCVCIIWTLAGGGNVLVLQKQYVSSYLFRFTYCIQITNRLK